LPHPPRSGLIERTRLVIAKVQQQQRTKRGNRKHNDTPVPVPVVVTQLLSLPDIANNNVPAATATLAKRPTLIDQSKQKSKAVVIQCLD
jgi:hypothetical protein